MHGGDLAAMHEPLKRSRVNLQYGRRLVTIQQWFAVYFETRIWCHCACRWLFLIRHGDSFLQPNCALLLTSEIRAQGFSRPMKIRVSVIPIGNEPHSAATRENLNGLEEAI
jgi:hypothetical protein